ncbi:MAG: hypothetical protein IT425_04725 [Pirellulales bacterium]|nr:hypothetical protein [Pirellulales bacterium]
MPTKDIAWRTFEEGLRGAGFDTAGMKPAYYMIPNPKLQELNRDVYIIVVELPSGKPGGTPRYLGLEMNPHQEELDPASFTKPVKLGRGKQIKVEYEASGEIRKMYVWLKN